MYERVCVIECVRGGARVCMIGCVIGCMRGCDRGYVRVSWYYTCDLFVEDREPPCLRIRRQRDQGVSVAVNHRHTHCRERGEGGRIIGRGVGGDGGGVFF